MSGEEEDLLPVYGDYEDVDDEFLISETAAMESLIKLTNHPAWTDSFVPWLSIEMSSAILTLKNENASGDAVRAAQGRVNALESVLLLHDETETKLKEMHGELDRRRRDQQ